MDFRSKLDTLAQAAQYDLSCACGQDIGRTKSPNDRWIYPAALPNGGTIPILKVLQSSGCERNCIYCRERQGGVGRPVQFEPEELSFAFMELVRSRKVNGLFLSSAIRGSAVKTMDKMLATAEILRFKMRFFGYIHLKIIPGADDAQILRAMQLATRVSVNLEAPTKESLKTIAPSKDFDGQVLHAVKIVAHNLKKGDFRCKSQTTQFVVGAADETDQQILSTLWISYKTMRVARGYFSAFQPVAGTPGENKPAAPTLREHRLYQADFLMRKYGFAFDEMVFDKSSNLSFDNDPKTAWVEKHPEQFPIEINKAPREQLLRVPGIGPLAAEKIVEMRRLSCLDNLDALKTASPLWHKAAPYLLFKGRRHTAPKQLSLFEYRSCS